MMKKDPCAQLTEESRCRMICDIMHLVRDYPLPDDARDAAMTFESWLARRMPWDSASNDIAKQEQCAEMRELISEHQAAPKSRRRRQKSR